MAAGTQLLDEAAAVEEVGGEEREQLLSIPGWRGVNNPWMPGNDTVQDFSYINLLENPERYTGYQVHACNEQSSLGVSLSQHDQAPCAAAAACTGRSGMLGGARRGSMRTAYGMQSMHSSAGKVSRTGVMKLRSSSASSQVGPSEVQRAP